MENAFLTNEMKPGSSGEIGHAYGKTNPINVLKAFKEYSSST